MKNEYNNEVFDALLKETFDRLDDELLDEEIPELSEEEEREMNESLKRVRKRLRKELGIDTVRRTFTLKRVIVLAAAVILLLGVFSVSGSAIKKFIYKTKVQIKDNVMKVSVDYEGLKKDYNTISKFEQLDEVIVPAWLPAGTRVTKIEDSEKSLCINYAIQDKYLDIDEWNWSFDYNNPEIQLENNVCELEKLNILDMEGTLLSVDYEDNTKAYIFMWGTEEMKYKLTTDLSYEELLLIIDELTYLRK